MVLVLTVFLAVMFVSAGTAKLLESDDFKESFNALTTVKGTFLEALAFVVPIIEIGLGYGLASGVYLAQMSFAALVLLVCFTGLLVVSLARGTQASCGCFGEISKEPVSGKTIIRNIALVLSAAFLFWTTKNLSGSPSVTTDSVMRFVGVSFAAVILLSATKLIELERLWYEQTRALEERTRILKHTGTEGSSG